MKYEVKLTGQFKRDLKLAKKQGKDIDELFHVINTIAEGKKLDAKYRDHGLSGNYAGCRECHVESDWLLVYEVIDRVLVMGRIDPVESIGVSQQRNGNALNVKPPAMRVRDGCYTKNHLSVIIEVFRPLLEKGKVISWQSKQIRSHIRSGCVSTTSSSPPSIDEKLSIINTKQICGIS